nr:retrovirus-related Pol polyprotein from transposon TNT 1-94 [Tanacetum cinerariifolium]
MNMGQDRQMQVVGGNGGNQFRQPAGQNVGNLNGYNDVQTVRNQVIQHAVQNPRIQNVRNQNGLIGVPGNANQNPNGNGNLVAAHAEGNATRHNGNQIRCYNCREVGHFARNYTVRPRRRDVAYLQTQLLIAQKEEAGIQLQAKEFDLMAAAADLDELEEANANCILMANLQQASTSGTQTDKAPVYDSDGLAEVHNYENCYDNEIFNMFTQEEQYTELLEPIFEPHQVPQNDNNVISKDSSVEQSGGIVEQHPVNLKETRALYDSLYNNLAIEVEKINTVNRNLSETDAELTTELARYKTQERCFEISQEKYDKLERCYQKSAYQEQCLSKKINALHLNSGKQIMTLNDEISDLNKQLSMKKSTVSSLLEQKKKLKSDFKIREDELLDKQIQLEKRIKELDNILIKTGQSIQMIHMLSPKPDSFYHNEQKMALEETLQLAQESHLKMKHLNKEIKPANYTKINHLSRVFVSQMAKSREELYFSNTFKTANVSKPISIPNEEFSDDTTPSVARKFLNKVKSTIMTLQRVVKQRMTLKTHNWSSSAHQELHKIVKDEIFPILNQVDARMQNFEIQFLKEAAKFVGDFKSLAKEAGESLAKHKVLELEIERLLRAVVSRDIMSVVQNNSVDETSNVQTELERTKERFKNCIIKKENGYAKLWNNWYKKCEECKFDKISYDKAYNDMQQNIERLQAQLGDLKGKSKDTSCVSDTFNSLSQKLENENVELEFQVSDQKDTACGKSVNTKFAKQSILGKPPKVGKTHALSKPVTLNSVSTPQESKGVNNDKVIAPGMFRINPFKPSREEKHVPNKVKASIRTKPITVSQPPVITKKVVNSDSNGLSSTGVDNTKTRRPQPRSNTKTDRVPSASKSSRSKNKEVEVEEHHRKLLLSRNKKHMSSECNNIKLVTQNIKSKVVCDMCKQCLNSVNHDVCLLNYVNDMTSRGKKQTANVSIDEKQKKQQPKFKKTKKVGFIERLASPKPSKPRSFLRWSPTGRLFHLKGKIIASSKSESQSDCSQGNNACTSNPLEPTIKRFPNSTFTMACNPNMFMFLGTVRFENDHVAVILGFGDLQWGNFLITRVYFIEGLGHNLFSVGQFYDSDLEVAFRRNACFVRNLEGVDLLKGDRTTNLYTINLHAMASTSPICLMARASSTKSWLWHQRLSYLNFDTINDLAKNDLVFGLPKFKYHKEHLCPSCEQGKSKRASHPPKPVPNSRQRLHLLHMDLCGPMRIASINGKRYVLVIVDDYSCYTWVHFLRSKDEAPEILVYHFTSTFAMSTQQDIYAASSESRIPMLNKENYVTWSSRLLRYAKSRPNGKLIHNSIINGPYVRRMIPEPEKELKQIEADDQAIQTILLGLPKDIYAAVDSCETAQEIWLRVQQMMKGSDIGIQEKNVKLFNEWERFTSNEGESIKSYYHRFLKLMNDLKRNKHFPKKIASNLNQLYDFLKYNQKEVDELKVERLAKIQDPLALMANSNTPYAFPAPHQDQPSFNQNYMQQPMPNPEDITDPTTAMNMALALMAKAFKLNYSTTTRGFHQTHATGRLHNRNAKNLTGYNDVQNIRNQIGNCNLVAARAKGNAAGQNGNQIRCYNCRGVVHYARNCTVRPRRMDAAYLQTQLLIAQKEEAGIQLQAEEFDLMVGAADLDEIEEVNANYILMANLQQASTSGTQNDKALVYDSDRSAEVHDYENYDDNEIFNMFTQEEQYIELLKRIPEQHQVPQNDNNVISEVTSLEQSGETVEQHPVNFEKT